jgi:tetratricopeptide (TPR) repeat protein
MEDSIYIKRLKERLRQNHDSKVFLSLAEELRKQDRTDEAIAVLIDGIKRHPDFIAARLTLGRWYLFSNMLSEAQKEYSEVIKQSPDNIFARKGLDEVNKGLGITTEDRSQKSEDRGQKTEIRNQSLCSESLTSESLSSVGREAVIDHLNKFLEEIKIRFVASSLAHKDKDAVVNRLDRFLNTIKIHFASSKT